MAFATPIVCPFFVLFTRPPPLDPTQRIKVGELGRSTGLNSPLLVRPFLFFLGQAFFGDTLQWESIQSFIPLNILSGNKLPL